MLYLHHFHPSLSPSNSSYVPPNSLSNSWPLCYFYIHIHMYKCTTHTLSSPFSIIPLYMCSGAHKCPISVIDALSKIVLRIVPRNLGYYHLFPKCKHLFLSFLFSSSFKIDANKGTEKSIFFSCELQT